MLVREVEEIFRRMFSNIAIKAKTVKICEKINTKTMIKKTDRIRFNLIAGTRVALIESRYRL